MNKGKIKSYLPSDASGDYLFPFSEIFGIMFSIGLVLAIKLKYFKTYEGIYDKIPWYLIIFVAIPMSCLVHPNIGNLTFFNV